ncbi:GGDEF domain-containing protein [Deinococcus knuensis]|uniref:GGDEF domain-containing protein n=1 Tax=Deinococcus knuensis TaxID=1837380 RepID=A0ABQ2SSF1_9DEIO|nr:GGDEF domain-containing protein [Deinococcus knuensis]GGS36478.1 hypothetical protein GCM10008961_30160 [Deinococcus knuensis]
MNPVFGDWTAMTVFSATTTGVGLFVAFIAVMVAWRRPSYPGWRGWAAGLVALTLGFLVAGVRTLEFAWVAVVVGNGLIMLGAALFLQAFQRFGGEAPSRRDHTLTWGAWLAVTLLLYPLTVPWDVIELRFVLILGFLGVMTVRLASLLLRHMGLDPTLRGGYGLNLLVLLTVDLMSVPRVQALMTGTSTSGQTLTVENLMYYAGTVVLSIGGTAAFWLLHDDRRRRDLHRLNEDLRAQVRLDALTGLLNRRGFHELFREWSQGREEGTLLVLDVNHFKALNDGFGHAAGDAFLVELAGVIRSVLVEGDLGARLGGDEFAVLLVGEGRMERARRVREVTGSGAAQVLACSVSAGETEVEACESLDAALRRADAAMYEQKRAARGAELG